MSTDISTSAGQAVQASSRSVNVNVQTVNGGTVIGSAHAATIVEKVQTINIGGPARSNHDVNNHSREQTIIYLQSKLRKKYSTTDRWVKRLPWLGKEPLDNFFVDLSIQECDPTGVVVSSKSIKYEDLLRPLRRGELPPKCILVTGRPGFGKTTLMTKIAYDWAVGRDKLYLDHPLALFFKLRDLPTGTDLEDQLKKEITEIYNGGQNAFPRVDEVLQRCSREKFFIILDGYDELHEIGKNSLKKLVGLGSYFTFSTIIVTSRADNDIEFLHLFNRHIQISCLSTDNRNLLIKQTLKDETKSDIFIKTISKRRTSSIFVNMSPLVIYMVCFIFHEKNDFSCLENSQALVHEVVRLMITRQASKLCLNLSNEAIGELIVNLGRFFLQVLKDKVYVFTLQNMSEYFRETVEIVRNLEILQCTSSEEIFEPLHGIFVESMAAGYLNYKLQTNTEICEKTDLILQFLGNPKFTKIFLVYDYEDKCKLVVRGKMKELYYCCNGNSSYTEGQFLTTEGFSDLRCSCKSTFWYNHQTDTLENYFPIIDYFEKLELLYQSRSLLGLFLRFFFPKYEYSVYINPIDRSRGEKDARACLEYLRKQL